MHASVIVLSHATKINQNWMMRNSSNRIYIELWNSRTATSQHTNQTS